MHLTMNILSMANIFNLFKAMKTTAEKIKAVFGFIVLCVEFYFSRPKRERFSDVHGISSAFCGSSDLFRTEYFYFQNQFMLFVLMQIDMTQFLDLTRQVLHKSIFRGSELRKQKSR